MARPTPFAVLLLFACSLAVPARSQDIILARPEAPPAGFTTTEDLTLQLDGGTFTLGIKDKTVSGNASARIHNLLDRTRISPDEQAIKVLESTNNIVLGFGKLSQPKAQEGHLAGKDLVGKKVNGHWVFELAGKAKADGNQRKALHQLEGYIEVVEALEKLYSSTPHKVGDIWKPDLSALKKSPVQLDSELQCKLEEVMEKDGDQIARISIEGHLAGALEDTAKVNLDISGRILRSLRDFVDLELELTGTFDFTGSLGKPGGPTTQIKAPVLIKRTVKVAKQG